MRKLAIFLGLIATILAGLYAVAFSQWGNNLIKPYIEEFVSKKIQKDVKLEKFTLTFSHLTLQANVSNEAILIVDGGLGLLSQSFDLKYHIQAQNLKTPVITIKEKLEVDGHAKGDIDDFNANGNGHAFGSNIKYNVHLLDKMPLDGVINAKGLQIEQLLALAGKPAYISGKLDIDSNIKNTNNKLSGTIHLLTTSTVNSKLVKRDFNISLPKDSAFVAKSNGTVTNDTLSLQNDIVSSLANLQTEKTDINLKNFDLNSDFALNIPNLSTLEFITKKKLYGKLDATGQVNKKADDIYLAANSKIFDGKLTVKYMDNDAKVVGENFNIKKILAMLGEPALAYGAVNINLDAQNLDKDNKSASMHLDIKNGEIVGSLVRKKFNINLPAVTNFTLNSDGTLKGDRLKANSKLNSSILNILAKNTSFNLTTKDFSSDFDIDAKDLKPLGQMASIDMRGNLKADGSFGMKDKNPILKLNTKSLGGDTKISLKNGKLSARLDDVLAQKIAYILNKPNFIKGNIDAKADMTNVGKNNMNGDFKLELKKGKLLGKGLKQMSEDKSAKYPESIPLKIASKADVKNGLATFTNTIDSSLGSMPSFKGTYDVSKKILNSNYSIKIPQLSNLAFLTGQAFHGKLDAKGVVNMKNDNLYVTADAPILGGVSKSVFDKGILTAKANGISTIGLSEFLDYPKVFDSKGDFTLKYNTKNKKGNYNLLMKKGRMVPNKLSQLVGTFTKYDMTKEVYEDTVLKGVINKENVTYLLDMKGSQTSLNIPNGKLNTTTKLTNADFLFKLQKTDIRGKILGKANAPDVKITGSNYLQKKAIKALDKHIPEKQKAIVNDLLKLF